MIREHAFNTTWWGAPVAFVEDAAFFDLDRDAREAALAPYAWAEFKSAHEPGKVPESRLREAGFFLADLQLEFRIGLRQVPATESLSHLEARFADEAPFSVGRDDSRTFGHERFGFLPGGTSDRLNRRYVDWANHMIAEQPEWCVQIESGGDPQGWLISRVEGSALELTLGMLHRDATVTGAHVYHKALRAYAGRGARIGGAAFSAANLTVLNIYAALGARFTGTRGCWLWYRE